MVLFSQYPGKMVAVLFTFLTVLISFFFFFTGGDHVSNLVLSSAQENGGKKSFRFSKFLPQKKCTDLRMNTEEFYVIAFFPSCLASSPWEKRDPRI